MLLLFLVGASAGAPVTPKGHAGRKPKPIPVLEVDDTRRLIEEDDEVILLLAAAEAADDWL